MRISGTLYSIIYHPTIVDHDISIFFAYNLKLIGQESLSRCLLARRRNYQIYDPDCRWICSIWAATACRFIREGKRFAARRLDTILRGSGSTLTAPEKHLDEIYTTVLRQSVAPEYTDEEKEEAYYTLRTTLGGIVNLLSPLSALSLSRLLGIKKRGYQPDTE